MNGQKTIALLAGTGLASKLFQFLDDVETVSNLEVQFGDRRGEVLEYYRGKVDNLDVIILPRHGPTLEQPDRSPAELVRCYGHEAHIWHFHELGVAAIYSFNSVGSLDRSVPLAAEGQFLIPDQYARGIGMMAHSFGEKARVIHPSMAQPFDEKLRRNLMEAVKQAGSKALEQGTYITSLGDVFESYTEVQAYRLLYASARNRVLGMTCGPELLLSHQMEIPYAAICANCNWAEGLEPAEIVTHEHVLAGMEPAAEALKNIAQELVTVEARQLQSAESIS